MNITRLKEIREDKDLLQIDIAKLLNTTQCQYSLYENGLRLIPLDKLIILADFYNVSLDYLVGRTDERKTYSKSILK